MKTDDPKFTAHALGEIEDLTPAERAEIETLIEDDTAAAAEDAETRKFAARLREELQREKTQPLTAAQRTRVLAATQAGAHAKTPKVIPFPRRSLVLSAIAACLIVGLFFSMIYFAIKPDTAARERALDWEQGALYSAPLERQVSAPASDGILLPPDMLAAAPQDRLTKQGSGTLTLSGGTLSMNTPNIDVIGTTAQRNSFKVAPNQTGITLNADAATIPLTPATNPAFIAGSFWDTPQVQTYFDRGVSGSPNTFRGGLASSQSVGNEFHLPGTMRGRVGSDSWIDTSRFALSAHSRSPELNLFGRPRVSIWPVPTTGAQDSNVTRTFDFDTGIGSFPDGAFAGRASIGKIEVFDYIQTVTLGEQSQSAPSNADAFDTITDNPFLPVHENPLSTFSTDVDTASYAIVRRFLNEQRLPPKGAVRIEELLNYFTYDYPQPKGDAPFSATMEVAACPWTPAHRLVRIGLKGREIARDKRPASNLVFLLDVSGSMQPANRLPLLKQSLGLLIDQLGAEDRVAMVVYAGSSGCVLESTHDKAEMRLALSRLEAGGSTNGGAGIQLAYEIARKNFIKGGVNRVILGTDGDWNVGITNQNDLFDLITQQAKSGVFLTALGVGFGNLKDSMLVKLADKGNGNYGYIDTLLEAKKLLVDQLSGTLVTIAKDVKIQVEFNPAQVSGYRLIGYEKRLLAKEDFNDDKKDAGEIGAGHTVTALYEVVPVGKELPKATTVDALKYQGAERSEVGGQKSGVGSQKSEISPELLTLKLRYKAPDGDTSKLLEFPLTDAGATWEKSSRDFRFAAAVASYGMLLRDSPHRGNATWNSVRELAVEGQGEDANGYRAEFISLIEKAQSLTR